MFLTKPEFTVIVVLTLWDPILEEATETGEKESETSSEEKKIDRD